jgi:hypothetical protein
MLAGKSNVYAINTNNLGRLRSIGAKGWWVGLYYLLPLSRVC